MQPQSHQRRTLILWISGGITLLLLVSVGGYFLWGQDRNPYGEDVNVQGYSEKVKNLPEEYRYSMMAALRDMIAHNLPDGQVPEIKDARIRDGSAKQDEPVKYAKYTGSFIVDIESIQQSYLVQYEYATRPEVDGQSGYPMLVSCLPEKDLIYGTFGCRNLYASNTEAADPIVGVLPHATVSFQLKADLTGDSLLLLATLRIPDIDLSGNLASRKQTVKMYKNEVFIWLRSQGFDPGKYTFHWSHNDDGSLAPPVSRDQGGGD